MKTIHLLLFLTITTGLTQGMENPTPSLLCTMPQDIIVTICSSTVMDETKGLEQRIKNFSKVRSTCTYFSTLLAEKTVGISCSPYKADHKNALLQQYLNTINPFSSRRFPLVVLVYAGTDLTSPLNKSLVIESVRNGDIALTTLLLEHKADPNTKSVLGSALVCAKSTQMAQLLIKAGAEIKTEKNLLRHPFNNSQFSLDLIPFYLSYSISKDNLNPNNGDFTHIHSLCCTLANNNRQGILPAAQAIIAYYTPEMINKIDSKGKTPLDYTQEALEGNNTGESADLDKEKNKIIKELIVLLKNHGAKSGRDLKKSYGRKQRRV